MKTPWGIADHVAQVAPGIVRVNTPSHGGYKLDEAHNAEVLRKFPDFRPFGGNLGWYEEDCDWAYVALTFPDLFPSEAIGHATATIAWQTAYHAREGKP